MNASLRRISSLISPSARTRDEGGRSAGDGSRTDDRRRQSEFDLVRRPSISGIGRPVELLSQNPSSVPGARQEDAQGKHREAARFLNAVKLLRFNFRTQSWSPSEPGMLRLLESLATGMTRLQVHSTASGRHDRLLVNCFLTPRMHLELARTHSSGSKLVRAFTVSTANDWSTGEPRKELFALKFPKTAAGLTAAREFAALFDSYRDANAQILEDQDRRRQYHGQLITADGRPATEAGQGGARAQPSVEGPALLARGHSADSAQPSANVSRKQTRTSIGSFLSGFRSSGGAGGGKLRKASPQRTFQPQTGH